MRAAAVCVRARRGPKLVPPGRALPREQHQLRPVFGGHADLRRRGPRLLLLGRAPAMLGDVLRVDLLLRRLSFGQSRGLCEVSRRLWRCPRDRGRRTTRHYPARTSGTGYSSIERADHLSVSSSKPKSPPPVGLRAERFVHGGEELVVLSYPLPAEHEWEDAKQTVMSSLETLTHAERDVSALVLEGRSNKEIAHIRGAAVSTVAKQLERIYRRLGINSRRELVVLLAAAEQRIDE